MEPNRPPNEFIQRKVEEENPVEQQQCVEAQEMIQEQSFEPQQMVQQSFEPQQIVQDFDLFNNVANMANVADEFPLDQMIQSNECNEDDDFFDDEENENEDEQIKKNDDAVKEPIMRNLYMEQAVGQAMDLQKELKVKRAPMKKRRMEVENVGNRLQNNINMASSSSTSSHESEPSGDTLGVKVTGYWRWKNVVVPPNMYVVHTRRGHKKPLHIGLGMSFRYKPHLDSFLVIPSAMQTIIINANSICKELQGILIQTYVQWIIDDIETAYKRLDFSDIEEPMRVVNVQLREQAEAAIKDKVATMSISEVLSDKQPIIKELTKRLKEVAEGSGDDQDDRGLGIRIVTVQIKEAIVSSTELWQNLQKPFRASQKTSGRLAEIENDALVKTRELEEKKMRETRQLETDSEINKLRGQKSAEQFDRQQTENLRRHDIEQQANQQRIEREQISQQKNIEAENTTNALKLDIEQKARHKEIEREHQINIISKQQQFEESKKAAEIEMEAIRLEEEKIKAQQELAMIKLEKDAELRNKQQQLEIERQEKELNARLAREEKINQAKNEQQEQEINFAEKRQKISNILSAELLQSKTLETLPLVAKSLPTPEKLQSITISPELQSSLPGTLATIMSVLDNYGIHLGSKKDNASDKKEQ